MQNIEIKIKTKKLRRSGAVLEKQVFYTYYSSNSHFP